jgi:hypothetical protein
MLHELLLAEVGEESSFLLRSAAGDVLEDGLAELGNTCAGEGGGFDRVIGRSGDRVIG